MPNVQNIDYWRGRSVYSFIFHCHILLLKHLSCTARCCRLTTLISFMFTWYNSNKSKPGIVILISRLEFLLQLFVKIFLSNRHGLQQHVSDVSVKQYVNQQNGKNRIGTRNHTPDSSRQGKQTCYGSQLVSKAALNQTSDSNDNEIATCKICREKLT